MKHFIVEIIYRKPFDTFGEVVGQHRMYLSRGFELGMILFSGPQVPRLGGILVARANSIQELAEFLEKDPYRIHGLADYRIVQFDPTRYHSALKEWFEE